jgi:hypothetical protein
MSTVVVKSKDFLDAVNQYDGDVACKVWDRKFLEIKRLEDRCNALVQGVKIPLLNDERLGSFRLKKSHLKEIKRAVKKTNSELIKIVDGCVYFVKGGRLKEYIEVEIGSEKLYFKAY